MDSSKTANLTQLQPDLSATPSALRFYDPEIQNAANAEPFDKERFQRASERAEQLKEAYLRHVAGLADRVSKRTFSLISDPKFPLFDADLFEFSIGDGLGHSATRERRVRPATSVRAAFCSFDEKTLHTLTYSRIASAEIKVPHDRWFKWPAGGSRIDSLLANEVTSVSPSLMMHAFLFVSGTTICIEFEQMRWETKRNRSAIEN